MKRLQTSRRSAELVDFFYGEDGNEVPVIHPVMRGEVLVIKLRKAKEGLNIAVFQGIYFFKNVVHYCITIDKIERE